MKKHYISNSTNLWISIAFLLIGITSFITLSLVTTLITLALLLPIFIFPFLLRKYVAVQNGNIYRYTEGSKNKKPEITIAIDEIVKIEVKKVNNEIKHLRIFTDNDAMNTLFLRCNTLEVLLEEILRQNSNIIIV